MHDYHETLVGYDDRQIWHDGCAECERRGERVAIESLDTERFERAWVRAAEWNQMGSGDLAISVAESDLLRTLWLVQIQLERRGVPIGSVPGTSRVIA